MPERLAKVREIVVVEYRYSVLSVGGCSFTAPNEEQKRRRRFTSCNSAPHFSAIVVADTGSGLCCSMTVNIPMLVAMSIEMISQS